MLGSDGKEWDIAKYINWALYGKNSRIKLPKAKPNKQNFLRTKSQCKFCLHYFPKMQKKAHEMCCPDNPINKRKNETIRRVVDPLRPSRAE